MKQNVLQEPLELGRIVITPAAYKRLHPHDIHAAIERHVQHDWDNSPTMNQDATTQLFYTGYRIHSFCRGRNNTTFAIISECDCSTTVVLLSAEFCCEKGINSPWRKRVARGIRALLCLISRRRTVSGQIV